MNRFQVWFEDCGREYGKVVRSRGTMNEVAAEFVKHFDENDVFSEARFNVVCVRNIDPVRGGGPISRFRVKIREVYEAEKLPATP